MKAAILSFTANGRKTAGKVRKALSAEDWLVAENVKCKEEADSYEGSLKEWTGEHWKVSDVLIYVGAAGIAVRAVASFVVSKKEDPAVLVIDELGKYCIPILSGHIGGANELAEKLSQMLSMEAVITTATDLNQKWAVDIFAKKNRLYIEDMKLAKLVSADILAGKQVLAEIEPECSVIGQIPKELKFIHESDRCDSRALKIHIGICKNDAPAGSGTQVLYLIPKAVVLGIGCKKGTDAEKIEKHVTQVLEDYEIFPESVKLAASIDLKKEEPGLCTYCEKNDIPFQTFSKEELEQAEGTFTGSEFVKQTTGVDNVCERSAMCAGGEKILVHKTAHEGVTVAVAVEKWSVDFE